MSKDGYLPDGVEEKDIHGNGPFEEYLDDTLPDLAMEWIEQNMDFLKEWLKDTLCDDPETLFTWSVLEKGKIQFKSHPLFWTWVLKGWERKSEE